MHRIILPISLLFLSNACNFSGNQKLSAKQLNDSAAAITKKYTDTARFKEAILLLDQAILVDSTNFDTYCKKYFFEASSGQIKNALKTLNILIKFRPDSAELYAHAGIFQELNQDTLSAKLSFSKAIMLYKGILDTMGHNNPYWLYDWRMSALCTIMIGQEKLIHDFLSENCTNAMDSSIYDIEHLSKTKDELLQFFKEQYSR